MKLVIYSHFFAPSIGGVESSLSLLAEGLAALRSAAGKPVVDLTVVTETAAAACGEAMFPFRIVRQTSFFRMLRLIGEADVVHVAGPSLLPLLLSWVTRKRVIVEHHGYQAICPSGNLIQWPQGTVCPGHFQAARYQKCLSCYAYQGSHPSAIKSLLLTLAREFLSRHVTANLAITEHVSTRNALPRTSVVYYGVKDPLREGNGEVPHSAPDKQLCFAYLGRFVSEKGIPLFLTAAAQLRSDGRKFKLLLIGDGPDRAQLEGQVRELKLGDCTEITGFLRGEALASTLNRVDVVVMPSVCEESAGLAAIEQMMRGRLVIASNIGGLGEVVASAGLRFPPGDIAALAGCMKRVLDEPELINKLGSTARKRALQLFTQQRMVKEHFDLYCELMGSILPKPTPNT